MGPQSLRSTAGTRTGQWRTFQKAVGNWIELCREQQREACLAQAWRVKGFLGETPELSGKEKESTGERTEILAKAEVCLGLRRKMLHRQGGQSVAAGEGPHSRRAGQVRLKELGLEPARSLP